VATKVTLQWVVVGTARQNISATNAHGSRPAKHSSKPEVATGWNGALEMVSVFARLERSMIVERVVAGMTRAKAQGKHVGRPRMAQETVAAIRVMLAGGKGIISTAKALGVGVGTVHGSAGDGLDLVLTAAAAGAGGRQGPDVAPKGTPAPSIAMGAPGQGTGGIAGSAVTTSSDRFLR
jgi:hypothetical protein